LPDTTKYDLTFTPRSYWGPQSLATHFGGRIKGEARRRVALNDLEAGFTDPSMIQHSLTITEARASGGVHPQLMGGEYLPDLLPDEVEIARIILRSTTLDVVSIRALKVEQGITYRIVDEYCGDEGEEVVPIGVEPKSRYKVSPKKSGKPLSMKQLIGLINKNQLVDGPREDNFGGGEIRAADEIFDFCTMYSAFYPDLKSWYDDANQEWRQLQNAKQGKKR
jgi:hypothetical protein